MGARRHDDVADGEGRRLAGEWNVCTSASGAWIGYNFGLNSARAGKPVKWHKFTTTAAVQETVHSPQV